MSAQEEQGRRHARPGQGPRPQEAPARRLPAGFQVVPAVDLLGEEAVRLEQGDFGRVARRAGDPAALVARFAASSPPLVHVVDLEGARHGRIRPAVVRRLVEAAGGVPVQASGGIRTTADAEALLAAGAARVVVGTAAFAAPEALARFVAALGERLVVAVDVRDGEVATTGWLGSSGVGALEAAGRCAAAGVARLLCTAVERDGTMAGPDVGLLDAVATASGLPVLAAGGVRSPDDLERLAALGLEGAVVGRALLEGALEL